MKEETEWIFFLPVYWLIFFSCIQKITAFGFCEFVNAEGALRAIRVLDKLLLGARDLQVKIGNKQHPMVLAYRNEMRSRLEPTAEEDQVDEITRREDQAVKDLIEMLLKDYENDLSKPLPGTTAALKKMSKRPCDP
jgi:hypothetical protein